MSLDSSKPTIEFQKHVQYMHISSNSMMFDYICGLVGRFMLSIIYHHHNTNLYKFMEKLNPPGSVCPLLLNPHVSERSLSMTSEM